MKITVNPDGTMELLGGSRDLFKEELVACGGSWHAHKMAWVFPLKSLKDVRRVLDNPPAPVPKKKTVAEMLEEVLQRLSQLEDRVGKLET